MNLRIFQKSAIALFILAGFLSIFVISRQGNKEPVLTETRLLMGTVVTIKISAVPGKDERSAMDSAFIEMARLEHIFSVYQPDSELSVLNKTAFAKPVVVSDELFFVVKKALEYNPKTNGVFDITIKPLKDLWWDARAKGSAPRHELIKERMSLTGPGLLSINEKDKTIAFLKQGVSIDLGGIAKGYIVDRGIGVIKNKGFHNAMISAGGDMYCLGPGPEEKGWRLGIQHPREKTGMIYRIYVKDKGVDTSGDYERYFIISGKRYSHIIDPRSGIPIGDEVVSATVIAEDSMTADIFATSLCILGEEGIRLAEKNGIDAMIIFKKGEGLKIMMTKDFKNKYVSNN